MEFPKPPDHIDVRDRQATELNELFKDGAFYCLDFGPGVFTKYAVVKIYDVRVFPSFYEGRYIVSGRFKARGYTVVFRNEDVFLSREEAEGHIMLRKLQYG